MKVGIRKLWISRLPPSEMEPFQDDNDMRFVQETPISEIIFNQTARLTLSCISARGWHFHVNLEQRYIINLSDSTGVRERLMAALLAT